MQGDKNLERFALNPDSSYTIDWSSVTAISTLTTYSPGQSLTLSGTTTGNFALPWTATIDFISSTSTDRFQIARGTQGGVDNALLLVMGTQGTSGARSLNQRMNFSLSVDGTTPSTISTAFTLLDVDTGDNNINWIDQIQVNTAGATLTSQNTAVTSVSGQTVTATSGNIANTAPDGNVGVFFAPGTKNVSLQYRPSANSPIAGATQVIGLSNMTFTVVPEANTAALLGLALPMIGTVIVARRRNKK